MRSRYLTFLALFLGAMPAHAQQQTSTSGSGDGCAARMPALTCTANACELRLPIVGVPGCKLRIDDAWLRKEKQGRITEETSLRVRIVGVNFLKYSPKFETKEKVVDSYVALEKLWQQALSLIQPRTGPGPESVTAFITRIKTWRDALQEEDAKLMQFVSGFTGVTLTTMQQDDIAARAQSVDKTVQRLEGLKMDAWQALSASADVAVFDSTVAMHDAVVSRMRAFQGRARLAKEGFPRRITFGDAGRIVTVTMTLNDVVSGTDAGLTEVVEFFVHSTLPVTFHAGYAYSGLDDFEFQPVAAAARGDLFSQIKNAENTSGFTAFLSYRIGRAETAPLRSQFFATLGTDFKDPGKRLFVGGSFRLKKVMISGGVATASVKEGQNPIDDAILAAGELLGTRQLFTHIISTRQWRPYAAITFAPF